MDDVLSEFVAEAREHLDRLEHGLVVLERDPSDTDALAGAFRAVHTIKGTCGFFGLGRIEALSHAAESALDRVREGAAPFTPMLADRLLDAVDALRRLLNAVTTKGTDDAEEGLDVSAIAAALDRPEAAGPARRAHAVAGSSSVRIDVRVLDRLMNLVGELVLVRNRMSGLLENAAAEPETRPLGRTAQRLDRLTNLLQATVVHARLEPIGRLWGRFPRLVRDLAGECGKSVRLVLRGNETEVDRAVLEAIADPLTHLVRNSIDHGIEEPSERVRRGKEAEARVELRASQEGGQFVVEVSDDGAGIDLERVRARAVERGLETPASARALADDALLALLFQPGFSTAEQITNVSGRGVGMDVVRTNIERLGGAVTISTRRGEGVTTRIQLPITLAIAPGLIVRAGGERLVIPQASLRELVRIHPDELEAVHDAPVYRLRGRLLPLVDLAGVLGLESAATSPSENGIPIAVVDVGPDRAGLIVDEILDAREIVVKPPGRILRRLPLFAGATILEDGRAALILDVARLASSAIRTVFADAGGTERMSWADEEALFEQEAGHDVLLCRLFGGGRVALRLEGVRRLEVFARESIERIGGGEVVPYAGGILRLVSLDTLLAGESAPVSEPNNAHPSEPGESVHAVVCESFALAVAGVEDVAEIPVGAADTTLIGGRPTRIVSECELRRFAEAVS